MKLAGAQVFDGHSLHDGMALVVEGDRIAALIPEAEAPDAQRLNGGILAPGFIDLQVNGGGGVMLDGGADHTTFERICAAHVRLGATGIMPTLITDRPAATRAVIEAAIAAAEAQLPGFLGLHLEGPHLDPRRHGAHDPALIRPMEAADLDLLCHAATRLPALIVTVAPASVTPDQIHTLRKAGAIVSLGHADCTDAQADAAREAGASMVTHLFNAMSQLGSRAPGLVGAALDSDLDCGIICDGVHVAPRTLRAALAAKTAGHCFFVSDAMAVAGTAITEFTLHGRKILRREGRLTLSDGTLAGADLDLPGAVANAVRLIGLPVAQALAMASRIPAEIIGAADRGVLRPSARADLVHLDAALGLSGVWQGGARIV